MDDMFESDDNERGGSPLAEGAASAFGTTGGAGGGQDDSGIETSSLPGSPHSSSGFRRALRHQASGGNRIIGKMGKGQNKGPVNRKFQGSPGRHGLHVGSPGHMHSPSGGGL
jgi:hypothetical protein